jgi:hypothetical protein
MAEATHLDFAQRHGRADRRNFIRSAHLSSSVPRFDDYRYKLSQQCTTNNGCDHERAQTENETLSLQPKLAAVSDHRRKLKDIWGTQQA